MWLQTPHNERGVNSARRGTEQRQQERRVLRISLKPPKSNQKGYAANVGSITLLYIVSNKFLAVRNYPV